MVKTLLEAVALVFLVMYLFLQNIRATLIPTIAVPVVLLGTFAVLYAFDYSINTLTMFAMVLAIGLLVDDAIVVVENVERIMSEEGLSPRAATRKSMGQIQAHWSALPWCSPLCLFQWHFWWHNRGHLSPVLYHHCLCHGAFRVGGINTYSGIVRHNPQTIA